MNGYKIAALLFVITSFVIVSCTPPELETAGMEYNKKRYESAAVAAEKAANMYPDSARAWFILGHSQAEIAKTKAEYEKANMALLKAKEVNAAGYGNTVDNLRYNQYGTNFNRSVQYYNQAAKMSGKDSVKTLAEKSIEKAEIAGLFRENDYRVFNLIARNYRLMGDEQTAESFYKQAYEAAPDTASTNFDYGYFLYEKKKYAESIPYLNTVAENPNNDEVSESYRKDALFLLSQAYDQTGQAEKAIEVYEKAVAANEENAPLAYNLGMLFYKNGNYESAAEYFVIATERGLDNADGYVFAGNSYNLAKMYEEALEILEEGRIEFQDNPQIWMELAKSHMQLGNKTEADKAYKRAQELGID
jgi:tetratricopeptide (TPR) repeat protein